jgi:hypothetical protein
MAGVICVGQGLSVQRNLRQNQSPAADPAEQRIHKRGFGIQPEYLDAHIGPTLGSAFYFKVSGGRLPAHSLFSAILGIVSTNIRRLFRRRRDVRGQGQKMNIVGNVVRGVGRAAGALTAVAGAAGGAVVNGIAGGVRGGVEGVRDGARSGSHSTPAAALTLGLLGAAGIIEWPLLLGVGGVALVLRQLRSDEPSSAATITAAPRAETPGPVKKSAVSQAPPVKKAAPVKNAAAPAKKAAPAKAPAKKSAAKKAASSSTSQTAARTRRAPTER